jgi:Tol biopolymer transport system component
VKAPYTFDPARAWYEAHEVFLWNPRSGSTRRLADVSGASVPTWSRDGSHLLYVSGDGLWLAPVGRGGKAVAIEYPLFPHQQWNTTSATISYFGQIDWTGQFSWWSP